ncbi:EamA/RhaT family transporter [Wenyingzhuangia sp. chi5]|uniref:EamA/RhaT family transporter n=1 Tax=Wenyingzhuangia gilva TaxID=3057677 RepID=A0ABT8VT00_9FLAO|nr:EamA/RhaT family transporter [Wenyingzhuangia sp. chi5]MDO3695100.1 EamA/RhaT family transporter [Wenyingzhuangia sp. chi5]
MIYLLLSILFTTTVFLTLKEFQRYQLDNFQAIVVSYFMALVIGCLHSISSFSVSFVLSQSWVWGALAISTLFIITFNLMAITAQKGGLSVMTVANKMSVVIPISIGVILYQEEVDFLKISGIVLALLGVWFTSKKKSVYQFDKRLWYLPFFIFIGSGLADAIINHMQAYYVPHDALDLFSTSLFFFCGCIGVMVLLIKIISGNLKLSFKNLAGGLLLGIPNYFSIYYLLKALSHPDYETSLIFSANNLLVVLISVLLGLFLYQEKLSKQNYIGLGMSVLAILVLYFAI